VDKLEADVPIVNGCKAQKCRGFMGIKENAKYLLLALDGDIKRL
jgi:hypothetical protein